MSLIRRSWHWWRFISKKTFPTCWESLCQPLSSLCVWTWWVSPLVCCRPLWGRALAFGWCYWRCIAANQFKVENFNICLDFSKTNKEREILKNVEAQTMRWTHDRVPDALPCARRTGLLAPAFLLHFPNRWFSPDKRSPVSTNCLLRQELWKTLPQAGY